MGKNTESNKPSEETQQSLETGKKAIEASRHADPETAPVEKDKNQEADAKEWRNEG